MQVWMDQSMYSFTNKVHIQLSGNRNVLNDLWKDESQPSLHTEWYDKTEKKMIKIYLNYRPNKKVKILKHFKKM